MQNHRADLDVGDRVEHCLLAAQRVKLVHMEFRDHLHQAFGTHRRLGKRMKARLNCHHRQDQVGIDPGFLARQIGCADQQLHRIHRNQVFAGQEDRDAFVDFRRGQGGSIDLCLLRLRCIAGLNGVRLHFGQRREQRRPVFGRGGWLGVAEGVHLPRHQRHQTNNHQTAFGQMPYRLHSALQLFTCQTRHRASYLCTLATARSGEGKAGSLLACFAVEGLVWGSRVSPRFHQTGIGRTACSVSVNSVNGAHCLRRQTHYGRAGMIEKSTIRSSQKTGRYEL